MIGLGVSGWGVMVRASAACARPARPGREAAEGGAQVVHLAQRHAPGRVVSREVRRPRQIDDQRAFGTEQDVERRPVGLDEAGAQPAHHCGEQARWCRPPSSAGVSSAVKLGSPSLTAAAPWASVTSAIHGTPSWQWHRRRTRRTATASRYDASTSALRHAASRAWRPLRLPLTLARAWGVFLPRRSSVEASALRKLRLGGSADPGAQRFAAALHHMDPGLVAAHLLPPRAVHEALVEPRVQPLEGSHAVDSASPPAAFEASAIPFAGAGGASLIISSPRPVITIDQLAEVDFRATSR